jgi:hypothetical protein
MGMGVKIPWIGGRNTMGRGFDILWVGGQNTMDRGVKIPWAGSNKSSLYAMCLILLLVRI